MRRKVALVVLLAVAAAGVLSTAAGATTRTSGTQKLTKVTLQLKWVTQAQFAGYYAAIDQGFYKEQGLDVTIKEGGVDIVPQTVLAQGQAD